MDFMKIPHKSNETITKVIPDNELHFEQIHLLELLELLKLLELNLILVMMRLIVKR